MSLSSTSSTVIDGERNSRLLSSPIEPRQSKVSSFESEVECSVSMASGEIWVGLLYNVRRQGCAGVGEKGAMSLSNDGESHNVDELKGMGATD